MTINIGQSEPSTIISLLICNRMIFCLLLYLTSSYPGQVFAGIAQNGASSSTPSFPPQTDTIQDDHPSLPPQIVVTPQGHSADIASKPVLLQETLPDQGADKNPNPTLQDNQVSDQAAKQVSDQPTKQVSEQPAKQSPGQPAVKKMSDLPAVQGNYGAKQFGRGIPQGQGILNALTDDLLSGVDDGGLLDSLFMGPAAFAVPSNGVNVIQIQSLNTGPKRPSPPDQASSDNADQGKAANNQMDVFAAHKGVPGELTQTLSIPGAKELDISEDREGELVIEADGDHGHSQMRSPFSPGETIIVPGNKVIIEDISGEDGAPRPTAEQNKIDEQRRAAETDAAALDRQFEYESQISKLKAQESADQNLIAQLKAQVAELSKDGPGQSGGGAPAQAKPAGTDHPQLANLLIQDERYVFKHDSAVCHEDEVKYCSKQVSQEYRHAMLNSLVCLRSIAAKQEHVLAEPTVHVPDDHVDLEVVSQVRRRSVLAAQPAGVAQSLLLQHKHNNDNMGNEEPKHHLQSKQDSGGKKQDSGGKKEKKPAKEEKKEKKPAKDKGKKHNRVDKVGSATKDVEGLPGPAQTFFDETEQVEKDLEEEMEDSLLGQLFSHLTGGGPEARDPPAEVDQLQDDGSPKQLSEGCLKEAATNPLFLCAPDAKDLCADAPTPLEETLPSCLRRAILEGYTLNKLCFMALDSSTMIMTNGIVTEERVEGMSRFKPQVARTDLPGIGFHVVLTRPQRTVLYVGSVVTLLVVIWLCYRRGRQSAGKPAGRSYLYVAAEEPDFANVF
eukprot:g20751.t1